MANSQQRRKMRRAMELRPDMPIPTPKPMPLPGAASIMPPRLTRSDSWTVLGILLGILLVIIIPTLVIKIVLLVGVCMGVFFFAERSHWTHQWGKIKRRSASAIVIILLVAVGIPQFISQWAADHPKKSSNTPSPQPTPPAVVPLTREQKLALINDLKKQYGETHPNTPAEVISGKLPPPPEMITWMNDRLKAMGIEAVYSVNLQKPSHKPIPKPKSDDCEAAIVGKNGARVWIEDSIFNGSGACVTGESTLKMNRVTVNKTQEPPKPQAQPPAP